MQSYHDTDAIGRAKELFEETDAGSTGSASKSELSAKLKADKQLETLLDMQDKDGPGMLSIMRMHVVLKNLEADGDGSIAWAEFQAAVAEANPEEEIAPALSARAKALFEAVVVEDASSGDTGSVDHRVEQSAGYPYMARQMRLGYVGPCRRQEAPWPGEACKSWLITPQPCADFAHAGEQAGPRCEVQGQQTV